MPSSDSQGYQLNSQKLGQLTTHAEDDLRTQCCKQPKALYGAGDLAPWLIEVTAWTGFQLQLYSSDSQSEKIRTLTAHTQALKRLPTAAASLSPAAKDLMSHLPTGTMEREDLPASLQGWLAD